MRIFQLKVRKCQIQDKSRTELNLGQVPEIKACPGKSRTDGHLNVTFRHYYSIDKKEYMLPPTE